VNDELRSSCRYVDIEFLGLFLVGSIWIAIHDNMVHPGLDLLSPWRRDRLISIDRHLGEASHTND
jgi:hypothetical protein